ncbi:MAG: cell division ATP-binding protein FtsE [Bdellovibrionales bacterium]|nr:cell division ATP-binding protein FtsE [Bdellovibrionales bacterium]
MISLSHLYKSYPGPIHALRDLSLDIAKGEFVFLTGPSGAGKTTLFKLICGYDKPTSGSIRVGSWDIRKLSRNEVPILRRQIGVVFQDFKLLRDRTVFENVALPLRITGEREAIIKTRVDSILDQVGLRYKDSVFTNQLSGGEQQRVAIARALVHRPEIIIADEPTGNLDPELSKEIVSLFERANAQGTTVVIATHDKEIVKEKKKREILLRAGALFGAMDA